MEEFTTHRLVKSEDLNHHKTLYAGRMADWFIEAGFVAVAALVDPKQIVCLKIHGMHFLSSVAAGQIIKLSSKVIYGGTTSLITYVRIVQLHHQEEILEGFISFVHVDQNNCPTPHNIKITPEDESEKKLFEIAKALKR